MQENKSLREKAIKIQNRDYVLVSDRVLYFNSNYPNGSITTRLISEPTNEQIVVKATITPDLDKPSRIFTGYSQAVVGQGYINKTSALENSETSAVGRALAFMGIGVLESIASADEMRKATGFSSSYAKTIQQVEKQADSLECHECGAIINKTVVAYSKTKFGKQLCRDCQNSQPKGEST